MFAVTLVKTIGGGPDITPVCTKEALSNFEVLCKISTERTRGKNCRLWYQHEWGVVNICDSRFTLTTKNQTVFLHLTSLTPGDSGNYTCECSHTKGRHVLHLSVTVEGKYLLTLPVYSGFMVSKYSTSVSVEGKFIFINYSCCFPLHVNKSIIT